MPKVQVNGINLFYEVHGAGEPLLLIYGLAGRGNGWKFQVEALSSHFQIITFDNRKEKEAKSNNSWPLFLCGSQRY